MTELKKLPANTPLMPQSERNDRQEEDPSGDLSGGFRSDVPLYNLRSNPGAELDPVGGRLTQFESFDPLPERWQDWWAKPDLRWGDRVWGMIDAVFLTTTRALGDKYVDMRRMQAATEIARAAPTNLDMALFAILFEGRTETRLKRYWTQTWKPVLDKARDLGISREDLHWYLYARHAPERNAQIAKINPAMQEGGPALSLFHVPSKQKTRRFMPRSYSA